MIFQNNNQKRLMRWLSVLSSWLVWSGFLSILLWFILFIATGEQFIIVRWLSYLSPWLVIWLLILSVIALLLKKIKLAISVFTLALLIGLPYIPAFVPAHINVDTNQRIYKIMTYNKMGRNYNISDIARVVIKEHPDILFMQEISTQESNDLIKKIMPHYQNKLSFFSGYDLILSRFNVEEIKTKSKTKSATIKLPEADIKVWNVHLRKAILYTGKQHEMTDDLVTQIAAETQPILVAGDFQSTLMNYPYIKLKKYLDNAFEQVGFGFGFTFPSPARNLGKFMPFLRIDHIFFSKHFKIYKAYVVKDTGGSDHYPVVAMLSLQK